MNPAILILGGAAAYLYVSKKPNLQDLLTRKIEPLPVAGFQDVLKPSFETWVTGNPEYNNPAGVPLPVGPNVPSNTEAGSIAAAKRFLDSTQTMRLTATQVSGMKAAYPWKDRWDHIIFRVCQEPGFRIISPVLVKAIMFQESGFNENAFRAEEAINDASLGLMQLLRKTARWIARIPSMTTDRQVDAILYNPVSNTILGMRYIGFQIGRYGRSTEAQLNKVIAAYNAGSAKFYPAGHPNAGQFINAAYVNSVRAHMRRFANHFPPLDSIGGTTPFSGKQ